MEESRFERFRRMMDAMEFESLPLFSKPYFSWNLATDSVGRQFHYRPETESTMDDARRVLDRFNLQSGSIVLAETQSAGRGRADRDWLSPPDVNLLFTLVMMVEPQELLRSLAYITPLAIARAVDETAAAASSPVRASLKWPNDVQIEGLKVAGVLIETTQTLDGEQTALIGVGLNVNLDTSLYPEIAEIATSLKERIGHTLPREKVLASFCNHFEELFQQVEAGSEQPFAAWKERLVTLGRQVTATGLGETIDGRAVDVEADGALLIERTDGSRLRVDAGDVTLAGSA